MDDKKEVKNEKLKDVAGGVIIKNGDTFIREDDDRGVKLGQYKTLEEAIFHANGVGTCPYCGEKLS